MEKGEEIDKNKFIVKLIPESYSERTYYISLVAKHELEVSCCVHAYLHTYMHTVCMQHVRTCILVGPL